MRNSTNSLELELPALHNTILESDAITLEFNLSQPGKLWFESSLLLHYALLFNKVSDEINRYNCHTMDKAALFNALLKI